MSERVEEDIELGNKIKRLFNDNFSKSVDGVRTILGWSWTFFVKKSVEYSTKKIINDMHNSLK